MTSLLEFSFTYFYPQNDENAQNGYSIQTDHLSCIPSTAEAANEDYHINFYTQSSGTPISASKAASSDEVEYYNPDDSTSSWAVKEYVEKKVEGEEEKIVGRTQKFGFYMSPASAENLQKFPFLFIVSLPTGGTGDYADVFQLNVSIKMTAEQILTTDGSTTG